MNSSFSLIRLVFNFVDMNFRSGYHSSFQYIHNHGTHTLFNLLSSPELVHYHVNIKISFYEIIHISFIYVLILLYTNSLLWEIFHCCNISGAWWKNVTGCWKFQGTHVLKLIILLQFSHWWRWYQCWFVYLMCYFLVQFFGRNLFW